MFWNRETGKASNTGETPTPPKKPIDPGPGPDPGPKPKPQPVGSLVLPVNAAPDLTAKVVKLADGREVFDWILVKTADKEVRFRLITPVGGPRPLAPFYIMESKVWNALYGSAINVPPESGENGPDAPVTGITAEEAATFAWAALGKEFRLPSPEEWDHAAGLYIITDRDNVTRGGGQPRDRSKKPEPTHGPNAGSDVNEFGLIDMAGNGREFTRMIQTKSGEMAREVIGGSVDPLAAADAVILRGRSFTLSSGLTFSTLKYEHTTPQRQFATARSPYTSFRVVVPVPEKKD